MNTKSHRISFFLNGVVVCAILLALSASISFVNINHVKAQDIPTGTPTAAMPEALKIYQDTQFGFSFLYPSDVADPTKWEPFKEILASISLFPTEASTQLQAPPLEISVTVYENPGNLPVRSWLAAHQSSESLFSDVGNISELKIDNHNAVLFLHRPEGAELIQALIERDQHIIGISTTSYDAGDPNNVFRLVVSSFKFTTASDMVPNPSLGSILDEIIPSLTVPSISDTPKGNDGLKLASSGYRLPWPKGVTYKVTQGWNDPYSHNGIAAYAYDFSMSEGSAVSASRGGTVALVQGSYSACGGSAYGNYANYVVINHDDGTATLYLHLKQVSVSVNQNVSQGAPIGLSGKVGWTSCAAHLHFQRQAQGGWWKQSTPIYFDEYPGVQLTYPNYYTSQNAFDEVPPTTSATLSGTAGENSWHRSAVQVALTATDNSGGSGVSQTQYKIDADAWQTYNVPFSVSANGTHTVYYKSVDVKGNWETVKSVTIKIDSVIPTGFLSIQNGSAQTYSTAVNLKTQGSDTTSGIAGVRFRDAGQVWSGFSAPGSVFWQLVGANGQTATVEAQFKDNAGNLSAIYPASIMINLYPARPSSAQYRLVKSTFGAAGMQANSSAYSMNGTAGQPMIDSMQSSNYTLNAGYWANLASSASYYAVSGNVGIAGATLTYFDGTSKTVVANSNGDYTIWIPSGWTGTIKPAKTGYVFTPASRSYASSPVVANLVNQNFSASLLLTVTYTSTSIQDGWVLESSEASNLGGSVDSASTTFRLGDDNLKKQYRSILSFSTGGLPDTATITSVTLKIKPYLATNGATPAMFQGFLVDVRKGFFSTVPTLEKLDFQAVASTPSTGIAVTPTVASNWYTFNLTTAAKAYINKLAVSSGLTQFRLRFKLDDNNNAIANYISFYSGNSAINKPTLIIQYYVP